jgi:hypothetical protein
MLGVVEPSPTRERMNIRVVDDVERSVQRDAEGLGHVKSHVFPTKVTVFVPAVRLWRLGRWRPSAGATGHAESRETGLEGSFLTCWKNKVSFGLAPGQRLPGRRSQIVQRLGSPQLIRDRKIQAPVWGPSRMRAHRERYWNQRDTPQKSYIQTTGNTYHHNGPNDPEERLQKTLI